MVSKKQFWLSKTFWVNLIALVAIIVQSQTEFIISPDQQAIILGFINMVLRAKTKEPISWS